MVGVFLMTKESLHILNTLISMDSERSLHGCFDNIPIEVYHHPSCPGISSTTIKAIAGHSLVHFKKQKHVDKNAFRFGNAFHTFVNEPAKFHDLYQVTYGRKDLCDITKIQLSYEDFQTIQAMNTKLKIHPDAGPLYSHAQHELTYFATDEETGLLKKCRVDAIKNGIISDLKSCEDASENSFKRDAAKWLYRISAAYYLEIVSQVLGEQLSTFNLIACEKTDPHEINVFKVTDRSLAKAHEEIREALNVIKLNRDHENAWAGYKLGIKEISI